MAASQDIPNPLHPSMEGKLNSQFKDIYTQYQAHRLRADQVTYEEYKLNTSQYSFPREKVAAPFTEVGSVTTYKVPVSEPDGEIEVEVFHPTADAIHRGGLERDGQLPVLVNYHGGGFVIGTLADDESLCRQTCQNVGCVVTNVAYRTAPEHPHPVPATDSWAALRWVAASEEALGIDASRIAVSGLSAGGCLAAVLALQARDDATAAVPRLVKQIMIVPLLDVRFVPVEGRPDAAAVPYESYISCEFAPMLPVSRLVWFYGYWLGSGPEREARARDWRASPMIAESLAGLPPASFHVAEVDPLRSEAEAYHKALEEAGTPSRFFLYEGVGHPFAQWDGRLDEGKRLVRDIAAELREAFAL